MGDIYIVCTLSDGSRYVEGASTSKARAHIKAEITTAQYLNRGYRLETAKDVNPLRKIATVPDVVSYWQLRGPKGERLNVELYRVADERDDDE